MGDDTHTEGSEDDQVADVRAPEEQSSGSDPLPDVASVQKTAQVALPALEKINALTPLISTVDPLLRAVQQHSELEKKIAEGLRATSSLAEAVNRLYSVGTSPLETAMANVLAVNLRGLDQLTVLSLRHREYVETARWSEQMLGSGALTSWRISLQANSEIDRLLKAVARASLPEPSLYLQLSRVSRLQVGLTDWVVQLDATNRLLTDISGTPLARWRDLVAGLSPESASRDIQASLLSGQTGLGILSADMLNSAAGDAAFVEESVTRIEADVLQPWEGGRLELVRELYERLGEIDPSVPELLEGAWDDLRRNGPAAVEKVAHCVTEALDRTLRAAAPDDQVREWHAQSGRSQGEWEGRERPPHSLRVKFLAQRLGGERAVVVAQYESLATLHTGLRKRLQAGKHASRGDLTTMRNLLLCAEDLLTHLFLYGDAA